VRIEIVAVGKVKEPPVRAILADYYDRIGRYAKLIETELKDGSAEEVGARFTKALPPRSRIVALEVDGKALSSDGLARFLGKCELDGIQTVAFLIGGSYGLPKDVSARADLRVSLSAMTLPHRLARVVLAEQVYRGFTILRGEPYSH
jgi:23S rRNA (pseudouridine1915-N3)-methyltransferase